MRQLLQFVLPPMLISTVLGLLLFFGTHLLRLQQAGALNAGIGSEQTAAHALPAAQSTLTAFLVACGLLLVICATPPNAWWAWAGGDARSSGTWRPTLLALGLMAAFVIIDTLPQLRGIFALLPLDPLAWALVVVAAAAWLFLTRGAWRSACCRWRCCATSSPRSSPWPSQPARIHPLSWARCGRKPVSREQGAESLLDERIEL